MLTTRSPTAGTARLTGSLIIEAPAGMLTDDTPLNVSGRLEAATMAESWSRQATCAEPIFRRSVPNVLASSTRTLGRPMLVFTTMRMVWLLALRKGGGPGFAGATAGAPGATTGAAAGAGATGGGAGSPAASGESATGG